MIHNSSSDPVLIKKISLKLWSLRDEVEARIQEQIEEGVDPEKINLRSLKHEYTGKAKQLNNVVPINGAEAAKQNDSNAETEAQNESDEQSQAQAKEGANPEENLDPNLVSIRVDAPKIAEDKIFSGKTVLAEIGMEKMFFFCNKGFTEGQSILIQFCIPKTFILSAEVIYCRPYSLKSKIISNNNFTHRALVKFNFLKPGERALLRQFLQSIEPDLSKYPRKEKAPEENQNSNKGPTGLEDLGL